MVKFVENSPFGEGRRADQQGGTAPESEVAPKLSERRRPGKKSSAAGPAGEAAPRGQVARRAALQRETLDESMSFLEEALCSIDGKQLLEGELRVLFLGPFALADEVANVSLAWSRRLSHSLGCPVSLAMGDPTYSEMDMGAWQ